MFEVAEGGFLDIDVKVKIFFLKLFLSNKFELQSYTQNWKMTFSQIISSMLNAKYFSNLFLKFLDRGSWQHADRERGARIVWKILVRRAHGRHLHLLLRQQNEHHDA